MWGLPKSQTFLESPGNLGSQGSMRECSPDSIEGGQDLLMEDGNEKFKKQSSVCMGEKDHGDPSVFLLTVAVHFTPQLARIVPL